MAKRNNENTVEMDEEEVKSLKLHDERYQIIKAMKNLQKALKPRYVRLDELVHNRGLQHLARYIFQYLNYQSLAQCRLVSKDWKDFIDHRCDNLFSHWKLNLSSLSSCKSLKLPSDLFHFWDEEEVPEFWSLPDCYPKFMPILDYIGEQGSLANLETFVTFLDEYLNQMVDGNSPLHYAADQKRFDIFEIVRQTPIDNMDISTSYSDNQLYPSLLGDACMKGHLEVIEYFIQLHAKSPEKINFQK